MATTPASRVNEAGRGGGGGETFEVGQRLLLWQRKTHQALEGLVTGFTEATGKYSVEYTHNKSTVCVSRKWLKERTGEAKANIKLVNHSLFANTSSTTTATADSGKMTRQQPFARPIEPEPEDTAQSAAVTGDIGGGGGSHGDSSVALSTQAEDHEAMMKAKREATFRRMHERHAKRQLKKEERRAAEAAKADPSESPEAFWNDFSAMLENADKQITVCVATHTAKLKRAQAKKQISAIADAIEEASELLADASRFLPKYDCRTAQDKVDEVLTRFDEGRAAIFPRQKFSFGSRVARKEKGTVASDVVAKMKEKQSRDESVSGGRGDREGHTAAANADVRWTHNANEKIFAGGNARSILVFPGQLQESDPPSEASWAPTNMGVSREPESAGDSKSSMTDVVLSEISNSTIVICDVMGGMRLDNLENCHVYTGPVAGSVFVDRCVGCTFFVAAKQMRIHNTENCTFCVHTQSGPIIEDCKGLGFSFYGLQYPGLRSHFAQASLLRPSQWEDVKDFKWLRDQHSPNWHSVPTEQRPSEPCLTAEMQAIFQNLRSPEGSLSISNVPLQYVACHSSDSECGEPTKLPTADEHARSEGDESCTSSKPTQNLPVANEDDSSSDGEL